MTPFGKLIVGVLILGALGTSFYFVNKKNAIPTTNESPSVTEVAVILVSTSTFGTTTVASGKKMAFGEFMKQDKNSYVCTVNQDIQGVSTKGTIYISSGKLNGVFTYVDGGKNHISYMLIHDGYSYSWNTNSTSTGIKVKTQGEDGAISSAEMTSLTANYWDPAKVGDYTCEATTISDSKFMLPSSVTFTEI